MRLPGRQPLEHLLHQNMTTAALNAGLGAGAGETAAFAAARAALTSGAWEERYAATARLARLGARQPSVVVSLLGRLRDEHASVRAAAAAALATLHEAQAHGGPMLRLSVQALVAAVDDAEVWVRLAARRALIACVVIAVRCALPFQRFYPCANASVRRSLGRP